MLRTIGTPLRLALGFGACVAIMAGYARPASADLTYTLTVDSCSGTCGQGPFGSIDLHQVDGNDVSVTVTLFGSDKFVNTGAGDSIEFNAQSGITVSGITSGFTQDSATYGNVSANHETFDYGITCTGCGHGASNPLSGPLSFTAHDGAGLSITDFTFNSDGYYFAADILGGNGNTGDVFAQGPGQTTVPGNGSPAPEPATLGLFGAGLAGLSAARRRKRS